MEKNLKPLTTATGVNIQAVQTYKKNGKVYIRKIFKNHATFQEEQDNILKLQDFLEAYEKTPLSKTLHFAQYSSDNGFNAIDYEKAPGEDLRSFLIRYAITPITQPDEKESHLKNLRYAGSMIAQFHLLYQDSSSLSSPQTFLTITHGDLHLSNVSYDAYDGHITLIDYSSLSYPEKKDVTEDLEKFFNHEFKQIRGWKTEIVETLIGKFKGNYSEAFLKESENRYLEARRALMEGYNATLKSRNISFELREDPASHLITLTLMIG